MTPPPYLIVVFDANGFVDFAETALTPENALAKQVSMTNRNRGVGRIYQWRPEMGLK